MVQSSGGGGLRPEPRIRTAIRHTRTTLSNTQIAQSGKFTAGDLTIDYDKHQVLIRGENAKLTVNEYKIVALLGKYAGKVLTYDFIIRELWGPKAKTDNQILRVNMANIRRKIDPRPAPVHLHRGRRGLSYAGGRLTTQVKFVSKICKIGLSFSECIWYNQNIPNVYGTTQCRKR